MRPLTALLALGLVAAPLAAQTPLSTEDAAARPPQIAEGTAAVWNIDESTTGGDVNWTSPSSVAPDAFAYDSIVEVTTVEVTALALGIFPITVDVTGDLPPELLLVEANFAGPTPIELLDVAIDFPGAPEPTVLGGDLSFGIDATGTGFFNLTNVVFGTAEVPNPLGGGTISAPITGLRIVATVTVDPASWLDLGLGLGGGGLPAPVLRGTGDLFAGTPFSLELSGAEVGAGTFVVLGFSRVDQPLKGGVLVPAPDLVKTFPPVGAGGGWTVPGVWPAGVPAGFVSYVQIWVNGVTGPLGFTATNGLAGEAR